MNKLSIRARLRLFCIMLVGLTLGLAGAAFLAVTAIEKTTEDLTVQHNHMAGLSRIDYLLHEVRLDELQLELISRNFADKTRQASVEQSAAKHRKAVVDSGASFERLIEGAQEARLWAEFQGRWQHYLAGHEAWIANGLPAGYVARSDTLFEGVDEAIDELAELESKKVEQSGTRAAQIKQVTINALALVALLALLFSAWVMRVVRNQVSLPLASITNALSSLAAGNHEVEVPEIGRKDEIGKMAKALEVFRQNAYALEPAHEAAEAAQKMAQTLSRHDVLTGLPNRRMFSEALEDAVAKAKLGTAAYAVFLIDLDRFKPVNDSHGHPPNVESATEKARILAKQILGALSVPIALGDSLVEIGCSVGIAMCPADGMDAENLLRAADIAMYKAKRAARGTACFFEQSMDTELRARAELEIEVRHAVAREHIHPHYQPLIDLADGKLTGFEILARWHHPERGIIMPDVFIPVAEELGLIGDLTFSILRRACGDARDWPDDLILSLNVSSLQLKDHLFPPQLLMILNETGFPPRRLEIEITESALVSDLETAKSVLRSIQSMGVKVSLDDFGTGYSSLYHLRELSFDKVKIDRSFIQSMRDNPESVKIVNAILSLTKSLGLPTTAEGLEDAQAVKSLTDAGCEFGQGYYFGKALSPADALVFVNKKIGIERAKVAG